MVLISSKKENADFITDKRILLRANFNNANNIEYILLQMIKLKKNSIEQENQLI